MKESGKMENYTAFYYKSDMGVVGQVLEWPEIMSVGRNVGEARKMLMMTLDRRIEQFREKGLEMPAPQIEEKIDAKLRESKTGG
jgi:predicted RNase H-like HicB family nuclease